MSELDVRLAEISRRLHEIQAGLAPDVDFVAAASAPLAPAPAATPEVSAAAGPGTATGESAGPEPAAPEVGDEVSTAEPATAGATPEPATAEPPTAEAATAEPLALSIEPAAEPPSAPDEPPPSPRSGPLAALLARSRRRRAEPAAEELATLVGMHNGLMTALGELVRLLGAQQAATPAPPSPNRRRSAAVSAGPFATPEEVEAFAARLSDLPPVRSATVVGYEGADRAVIEVQLAEPSG